MKRTDDILAGELVRSALAAREHSHSPYSKFRVGAALLARDGTVTTGCNVEISSFSLTCCAERAALFAAVSKGIKDFVAVAIVSDATETPPCGACRQALADFNPNLEIILGRDDGSFSRTTLETLYPKPFLPTSFPHGNISQ